MRHALVVAALFVVPALAMTEQNSSPAQPAVAQPKAEKMASDDVLARLEKGDVFFLDVREPRELRELGTFEGYVNIPLGQIEQRLDEIPRDRPIITA